MSVGDVVGIAIGVVIEVIFLITIAALTVGMFSKRSDDGWWRG